MKKALTIGELLITMAIIGTIATLVLPGFLKDYHKKLYVTKLKKTVETLENAINQACIDNNVSYFYQTPYAKVNDGTEARKFINKYFKVSNDNNTYPFANEYGILNTGAKLDTGLNRSGGHVWAKLESGEAISFLCFNMPNHACVLRVDINSLDGPNIGGRDYFSLYININTNEIYDVNDASKCGGRAKQENEDDEDYEKQIKGANRGEGCYARLLQDNWEMKY